MIERYETEAMAAIWSETQKYMSWLDVELAACEAWNEEGVLPDETLSVIKERAGFTVERIREIEENTHHDVIAFVSCVAETIGPEGRYIHLGLTSSDILDTASSLRINTSMEILLGSLAALKKSLLHQAQRYRYTPCVGRTHGIHAEPMTFGLKLLNWYDQLHRDTRRLEDAKEACRIGKISGAVGTYAHCPPSVEKRVCQLLGLRPARISTQVIPRDIHAQLVTALSLFGAGIERIATEIRHLQRTEVLEALEPFGNKQKGSSAMPHKKNPIIAERLCGMARLLRGYTVTATENIALWHERDISHSSAERIIWPDAFHLAHYMIEKTHALTADLTVNEDAMLANLDLTKGLVYSQRVLLALVEDAGMPRDDAYRAVQSAAMRCWNGNGTFQQMLEQEETVQRALSTETLQSLFHPDYYFRFVDEIFSRFDEE
ncbi:MAG: adenylosuccinate lyase [Synergistales bacterium]|nr:adenylosuccinate lyase [Synergistales bacterium]